MDQSCSAVDRTKATLDKTAAMIAKARELLPSVTALATALSEC
jgi:hypothetical protein